MKVNPRILSILIPVVATTTLSGCSDILGTGSNYTYHKYTASEQSINTAFLGIKSPQYIHEGEIIANISHSNKAVYLTPENSCYVMWKYIDSYSGAKNLIEKETISKGRDIYVDGDISGKGKNYFVIGLSGNSFSHIPVNEKFNGLYHEYNFHYNQVESGAAHFYLPATGGGITAPIQPKSAMIKISGLRSNCFFRPIKKYHKEAEKVIYEGPDGNGDYQFIIKKQSGTISTFKIPEEPGTYKVYTLYNFFHIKVYNDRKLRLRDWISTS